ncbi:MAG: hypothetical protein K0R54_5309 [Clostridiaceae bacterium]|jgi:hypothetical protein|nr:hypothetical protein [Clostridiaceae bacterium]
MIEDYFTDKKVWRHVTGTDDYNQPTYDDKTIDCKFNQKIKLVRDKTGNQVVSQANVFCKDAVLIDDLIDGRVIISVLTLDGLDGIIEGYEVYLI